MNAHRKCAHSSRHAFGTHPRLYSRPLSFYFIFIASKNVRWMFGGLVAILSYVLGTAYLTYGAFHDPNSHVEVSEGIANGLKAVSNTLVLLFAIQIMTDASIRQEPTITAADLRSIPISTRQSNRAPLRIPPSRFNGSFDGSKRKGSVSGVGATSMV